MLSSVEQAALEMIADDLKARFKNSNRDTQIFVHYYPDSCIIINCCYDFPLYLQVVEETLNIKYIKETIEEGNLKLIKKENYFVICFYTKRFKD